MVMGKAGTRNRIWRCKKTALASTVPHSQSSSSCSKQAIQAIPVRLEYCFPSAEINLIYAFIFLIICKHSPANPHCHHDMCQHHKLHQNFYYIQTWHHWLRNISRLFIFISQIICIRLIHWNNTIGQKCSKVKDFIWLHLSPLCNEDNGDLL